MADWGVYWAYFRRERDLWPVSGWRIGAGNPLARVAKGDRLWLFTSGDLCDMPKKKLGYLVEILTVESIGNDSTEQFDLLINGSIAKSKAIDPPLLTDEWIRPQGWDIERSIGTLRQNPWKLSDDTLPELQTLLRRERPDIAEDFFAS